VAPLEPITWTYRAMMVVNGPIVRRWGRLEVSGLEQMAHPGPLLLAASHDSYWDPLVGGIAALPHRQIRALAKASLWEKKLAARILDGMGQIPVIRGATDTAALERAISELRAGACIGLFPEGTRSMGGVLRARSGFGRLAQAVPEARIVCLAMEGTTDLSRFPRRPRLRLTFFAPAGGGLQEGETPAELSARLLAEIRERSPRVAPGHRLRGVRALIARARKRRSAS